MGKTEEKSEERWGVAHYHTLAVLFAAYAVGMYGKGTMSLGIFGMSKVATHTIVPYISLPASHTTHCPPATGSRPQPTLASQP